MTGELHLEAGELMRALDDELTDAEAGAVEHHLDTCDACRLKLRELGAAASEIDAALLRAVPVTVPDLDRRDRLVRELQKRELQTKERRHLARPSRLWYSGIAGAAIAAALALVLFSPTRVTVIPASIATNNSTLQVNGETFVALPYSNRDLAAVEPRIVEMQLPAASLASAGVVFEPVSSAASDPDRSVRADVLLGADGEPLGVHVFNQ